MARYKYTKKVCEASESLARELDLERERNGWSQLDAEFIDKSIDKDTKWDYVIEHLNRMGYTEDERQQVLWAPGIKIAKF